MWASAREVHSRFIGPPRAWRWFRAATYVVTDDVKSLVVPVLAHRVVGKSFLQAGEFGAAEAIIRDIVDRIRVPT